MFGNAEGAYGANVNHLIENGAGTTRTNSPTPIRGARASPTARAGRACQQDALLQSILADVDLAYQNLDSVELGVTTVDITSTPSAASAARCGARGAGRPAAVYIGDQTRGEGTVRTISEQVALETRTRALNPKWYEGMLKHGYEGVRQIEAQVTNTLGWSATTGEVAPWVYRQLTETYVLGSGDARAAGGAEPDGLGEGRQPAARGARAQLLDSRTMPCSKRCDAPARNWKTASKASLRR